MTSRTQTNRWLRVYSSTRIARRCRPRCGTRAWRARAQDGTGLRDSPAAAAPGRHCGCSHCDTQAASATSSPPLRARALPRISGSPSPHAVIALRRLCPVMSSYCASVAYTLRSNAVRQSPPARGPPYEQDDRARGRRPAPVRQVAQPCLIDEVATHAATLDRQPHLPLDRRHPRQSSRFSTSRQSARRRQSTLTGPC